MFWKKKNQAPDELLDRVGKSVARASGISEDKADQIATSPFLYARLRARIEAERKQKSEPDIGWFATFKIARRAIPALALVAIAAVASLWFAATKYTVSPPPGGANVEVNYPLTPVTACSLSSTDECAISSEEVLATMFAEQEGKKEQ
ncbi:MAG TPA: hypothetical protein VLR90_13570 [Blastocatellia bacterium]|nr:hypothetical protein [Blastocatellia bacterium]